MRHLRLFMVFVFGKIKSGRIQVAIFNSHLKLYKIIFVVKLYLYKENLLFAAPPDIYLQTYLLKYIR